LEAMDTNGYSLGGEQSGHIIFADWATTGDGILTGLHLAARMNEKKQSLTDLARVMTRLPQVLINVKDVDKAAVDGHPEVHKQITAVEQQLGQTGRVLLRQAATERVVSVLGEAADNQHAAAQSG